MPFLPFYELACLVAWESISTIGRFVALLNERSVPCSAVKSFLPGEEVLPSAITRLYLPSGQALSQAMTNGQDRKGKEGNDGKNKQEKQPGDSSLVEFAHLPYLIW